MPCLPQRLVLALFVVLALLIPAGPLSAQVEDLCSVDLYRPVQLGQATVFVQRAAGATDSETATKALRDGMRLLQDDRRFAGNPIGLAYLRAQIYILWLHQDNAPEAMSQFDLNVGRDRTVMIDLVRTADSLLTIVETGATGCEADIDRWRQSKPWSSRIGAVYRFLDQNAVDSAEFYVNLARQLDRRSPFLYNALAQIAIRRGDREEGIKQLEAAVVLADLDTSLVETGRQLRTQLALTMQELAMTKTDAADVAERNAMLASAARIFLKLGQDDPSATSGPAYISAALDIAMLTQDQVLVREVIDPMIRDPLPYPDLSLLFGAETSRLLNRTEDAITLYAAALDKNPNIRDANYFLAFLYIETKQPDKANVLLDRLIAMDPSNPENLLMKTMAARLVAEAERNTTRRAALMREVEALAARESSMPHRLQILRFERRAEGAQLEGDIENRSRAAKAYTVEVTFLNLAGEEVETLTVTTASAAPNAIVPFSVTATKKEIVAYRYKPLM